MSNKDHNYTDDGSTLAEDEMKHSFLVRVWRFLEDHLTVILLAFLPAWVVFYIVLFSILKILPEKLSEMENITDMHMACAAWALLGGWAVVAIGRLIRAFREGVFPKQPVLLLLVLPTYLEIFLFQIFFPCLPPFRVDLSRSFVMPMSLNTYPLNV